MSRNSPLAASAERVLVIHRTFDAPRQLVFQAWTQREHTLRWMAPRGFTIPECDAEVHPGGAWHCCMRSPDGIDHWASGVYREVVENERLVFTHAWRDAEGQRGHETLVTVTFVERNGKTELTLHQAEFDTVESCDGHRGGWNECLDRLVVLLAGAEVS